MSLKHKLKLFLREAYARTLFHSGAHALVDRLQPRRLTILAGHCVSAPSNAALAKDMKIRAEDLERILRWLARRYEVTNVGAAVRRLAEPGKRSLLALSMDDGYRDNLDVLQPLLSRLGLSATIYLESAPLDERRVNWTHKFFWTLDRLGAERFVEAYLARARDERTRSALAAQRTSYQLKRVLKYEAPVEERSAIVDALFREAGGDERALCDELYLDWEGARALDRAGIELGAHTVHHEILSRLDAAGARAEIEGSRRALERGLGHPVASFAYPFGRRWDYHAAAVEAARGAGLESATNTHAGTNSASTPRYELKRVMIDEDARLHLIATRVCGGFDLLRRFGLDLSE